MKTCNNKRAFTLVEIMIVTAIGTFLLIAVYKMLNHGFNFFFKGQTKLTNLRMANIVIEHIKNDVRAAVFAPKDQSDDKPAYAMKADKNTDGEEDANHKKKNCKYCCFWIEDKELSAEHFVEYEYDETKGQISRILDGESKNLTGNIKIRNLEFSEGLEEETKSRCFVIKISVDKDKELDENIRSTSSKLNVVELRTVLYPRFYEECLSNEEKFWFAARSKEND